jgi:predicted permease
MIAPPGLARWLLRLSDHGGHREEIQSDLVDLFERRLALHGPAYARRRYWRDVVSFYLPGHRAAIAPAGPLADTQIGEAGMLSSFWFDLRQVLRSVRRQPSFFAVAALTLGIGCAAHFAAFVVVDRLLLAAPAHVQDAGRVFRLHVDRTDRGDGRFLWWQTPYRAYLDLREQAMRPFAGMAAYRPSTGSVGTGATARRVAVTYVDHHYFPLLGVSAAVGRVFDASENQPPAGSDVIVLSDAFWRAMYASDSSVIGQPLRLGAKTYTIVGVMPPGFTGDTPDPIDLWAPLHAGGYELNPQWPTHPLLRSQVVLVRLAPGMAQATAAEETAALYRRFSEGTAAADPGARIVLAPLNPGRTQQGTLNRSGRIAVWLEGVSLLVLLVAVANVVNLLMSRAAEQRRELAVRVALGAGRRRLLARVALEMLVVAGSGAALGIALTFAAAATLQQFLLPGAPVSIDGVRFGLVAVGTMLAAGIICVAFAALQIRPARLLDRLKTGRGGDGFSRARLRQGLLVAQVVMSALLIVGAGLFLRSVVKLRALDFGHDQDRILVVTVPLRAAGYENAAIEAFYDRALRDLAAIPGVDGVAAAQSTPFNPSQAATFTVPGFDRLPFQALPTFYTVTPDFFRTMGMTILRGRGFTDGDTAGAPPVIVLEQALATALWPNDDAIGKCIRIGQGNVPCREIVGISSNTRRFVHTADFALRYYVPMAQRVQTITPQALFVRARSDVAATGPAVRGLLLGLDPNLPHAQIRVLTELMEPETRPWRLGSTLFLLFGAAALFVATAGVYALLNFLVTQRSREIGVRMALGASPGRTWRLVLRQSLGWIALGLAGGLTAAAALGRQVEPLLFETSPWDPRVFAGAAVLLLAVAVVASLAPAIRASRVDPNVALRAE